jgi:hypothetical protein
MQSSPIAKVLGDASLGPEEEKRLNTSGAPTSLSPWDGMHHPTAPLILVPGWPSPLVQVSPIVASAKGPPSGGPSAVVQQLNPPGEDRAALRVREPSRPLRCAALLFLFYRCCCFKPPNVPAPFEQRRSTAVLAKPDISRARLEIDTTPNTQTS